MRRSLAFIALALILVGLARSTEAISLTSIRLWASASAILTGAGLEISAARHGSGIPAPVAGVGLRC